MSPELIVAASGGLLILVAMSWRLLHRRRVDTRVAQALRDGDPARRRAAVAVATEQGLRPYATLLIALIDKETDPDVRTTLVEGVLRNAWEPADQPAILRLRLWAHEQRARGQAAAPAQLPVVVPPAVRAPAVDNRSATMGSATRPSGSRGATLAASVPDPAAGSGARHRAGDDQTMWLARNGVRAPLP